MEAATIALVGTFGGVAIGGGISLIGQRMAQNAQQVRDEREAKRRQVERREDLLHDARRSAAPVLGRVLDYLVDAHPDRIAFNFQRDQAQETLDRLREEWKELRLPLAELEVLYPSKEIGDKIHELRVALGWAYTSVGWLVSDMARPTPTTQYRGKALEDWEKANHLAEELRDALHDDAEPRGAQP